VKRPPTPTTLWLIAIAVIGVAFGAIWAWGWGLARSVEAPPGWAKVQTDVPFRSPGVVGDLDLSPFRWSLDHHEELRAPADLGPATIHARPATGARLELFAGPGYALDIPVRDGDWTRVRLVEEAEGSRQLLVGSSDELATAPPADGAAHPVVLRAGSRRVQLSGLGARPAGALVFLGAMGTGALLMVGFATAARRLLRVTHGAILFISACTLAGWPTLLWDPATTAEMARVQWLDTPWMTLGLGLSSAWLMAVTMACLAAFQARGAPRWRAPVTLAGAGMAAALWGLAVGCRSPGALAFGAAAGACIAGIGWVAARSGDLKHARWIVIGLLVAALLCVEGTLQLNATGAGWEQTYRWSQGFLDATNGDPVGAANRDFADLERGEHSSYPGRGYPVAYPPKGQAQRVVFFGGSSTGGAFVNDELDEFFPARVEDHLGPGVEAVNQGVGGWTSFHIRRYAETHLSTIDPDLVVLYVSNNDAARMATVTYEQLFGVWQDRARMASWAGPLQHSRILQGLTVTPGGTPPGDAVPAVSLDEAEANLATIAGLCRDQGAPLLLVGEGHDSVGADELDPYHELMRELAGARRDVFWLDGDVVLSQAGAGMFVDDVHLSEAGHRVLAQAITAVIDKEGLLAHIP